MSSSLDSKVLKLVTKLEKKYGGMGQDLSSYLEGLLHSDYPTYWDYIHLDTLLSLQNPKTNIPDERIFIIYHQITELYFHLILLEIDQITQDSTLSEEVFIMRMDRIIRYFRHLEDSFSIMTDGMDKKQFLQFRMALLPASGFQSAQYRFIELRSTDMINLVSTNSRKKLTRVNNMEKLLEKLYWREGAIELRSGKKTLMLQQFEQKYLKQFLDIAVCYKKINLRRIYLDKFPRSEPVRQRLREYDTRANVSWRLAHMKATSNYLHKKKKDIETTGGTNWQNYLPPRFQKVIFFPELWSRKEKEEWGKAVLLKHLLS